MAGKWCESVAKVTLVGKWWENWSESESGGKVLGKWWETVGKWCERGGEMEVVGKWWASGGGNCGQVVGKERG